MKAERLNLIPSIRRGLIAAGYSTVKVVSAVNAALGELKATAITPKSGDGTVTKDAFKVTNTVAYKFEGKKTLPLLFDAWHSAQAKADKIASLEVVPVPPIFETWLNKFAKGETADLEKETAEMAPTADAQK